MFQDTSTAVITMLFLYFAGMLVMFVFIIRSLASQGEERRASFRKQQLMLGDLERHLIDMKVMLRRLSPGSADDMEEGLANTLLPSLKHEEQLEAILGTVSLGKKEGEGKTRTQEKEKADTRQAVKSFALPHLSPDRRKMVKAKARGSLGLPDFFTDSGKAAEDTLSSGLHMSPPHETLGKSRSLRARVPLSGIPGEEAFAKAKAGMGGGKDSAPAAGEIMDAGNIPDADDQSLQVFSMGKNPMMQEEVNLSASTASEPFPFASAGAVAPATEAKETRPAPSKAMEGSREAFSSVDDEQGQGETGVPSFGAAKQRLRVFASTPFAPATSGKSVAGTEDASSAAISATAKPALAQEGRSDEKGNNLRSIFEKGLKAEDSINLFDLEAEKEEHRLGESGDSAGSTPGAFPPVAGEAVPEGSTVATQPLRQEENMTVAPKPFLADNAEGRKESVSAGISKLEARILSREGMNKPFVDKTLLPDTTGDGGKKEVLPESSSEDENGFASGSGSSQAARPLIPPVEQEAPAFFPREPHPIDRKILSKRKQPGKKKKRPVSF